MPSDDSNNISLSDLLEAYALVPSLLARLEAVESRLSAMQGEAENPLHGKKWLTLKEAAQELRRSPKSILRMIKAGNLRRDVTYWRIRIPAEDVEAHKERATFPLRS